MRVGVVCGLWFLHASEQGGSKVAVVARGAGSVPLLADRSTECHVVSGRLIAGAVPKEKMKKLYVKDRTDAQVAQSQDDEFFFF